MKDNKTGFVYIGKLIPPKPPEGVRFEFDHRFLPVPHEYSGLLLYQVGGLCCNANYELPTHPQWCHEISYIISGSASFYCNDVEYLVGPRDLFISPKGVTHKIIAHSQESLRFAYLGFDFADGTALIQYNELCNFFLNTKEYLKKDMQKVMEPLYLLIDEFFFPHSGGDLMIYSTMLQLLVLTYQSFTTPKRQDYRSILSDSAVGQMIYEVIRYVTRNLFTMSGIHEMAQELGYSEYYISHAFREKTGQTLQSYIIQKKMAYSIELLRLGNCSISAVAQQMGYANSHSFSKAFHKVTGYYPSHYMKLF